MKGRCARVRVSIIIAAICFFAATRADAQLMAAYSGSGREPGEQELGPGMNVSQWLVQKRIARTESVDEDEVAKRLEALAGQPNADPLMMVLFARHLMKQEKDQNAVLWLRKALGELGKKADQFPINIQLLIGISLARLREFNEAAIALEGAKRHYTNSGEPLEIDGMLASAYASSGNIARARGSNQAALAQTPGDGRAWLLHKALDLDETPKITRESDKGAFEELLQSRTFQKILGIGFPGAWAREDVAKNCQLYLSFADDLKTVGRPQAAQNYRETTAAMAITQAQFDVKTGKYAEALELFSLADRASDLVSLDSQEQNAILPFIVTAYLKQGLPLGALELIKSFRNASNEMRLHQYSMVLEHTLASISWDLTTGERTLDDPSAFADLVKGERWFITEMQLRQMPASNWPPAQLRNFWRKNFRYGMTNPDEDITTLASSIGLIPSLFGQEIDILLKEKKLELPVKSFLTEIEPLTSPMLSLLHQGPRITSTGQIQLEVINTDRLKQMQALIERSGSNIRRPTVEAYAIGQQLMQLIPSLLKEDDRQ
jgi:hypothetical protein